MRNFLPDYIDEVALIINKLIEDKKSDYVQYLIQRLFYTYIRLTDVIESGENLNQTLKDFIIAFTTNPPEPDDALPFEHLWYATDAYKDHIRYLFHEIHHLHSVIYSVINESSQNMPTDIFWREIIARSLNMGLESALLEFNIDFSTALSYDAHDDYRELLDGLKRNRMRFDFKVKDDGEVKLIDFEFPIPTADDETERSSDEIIDRDALNKKDINSLLTRFTSRRTLATMKLAHKKIGNILSECWGSSEYLKAYDLELIHLPDGWRFPTHPPSITKLISSTRSLKD